MELLLAVDVGNTHTVIGLYEGNRLARDFRIQSSRGRTVDEYHVLLRSLLEVAEVNRADVHASIIASVVPSITETLVRSMRLAFGHTPLVVGPGIRTGMPIL